MRNTELYVAKSESGTTLGYVHAESIESAGDHFASQHREAFTVQRADHVGPHAPNPGGCPEWCVS